jgi:protoheme IX farnesyltransferase
MIDYYLLLKPGIICGNLLTFTAGYLFATNGRFELYTYIYTLLGLAFVIASACVWNNYIDRVIDRKMTRTQNRPLASGRVSNVGALLFATVLLIAGNAVMLFGSSPTATLLADAGFVIYVGIYSLVKTKTHHSTLVGSLAGALPPLIGYCAVSEQIDAIGSILFLAMVLWQMPHFFAIGLWRQSDYSNAGVPILPVSHGVAETRRQMTLYIVALIPVLWILGVHYAAASAFVWLLFSLRRTHLVAGWGRQMFRFSLVVVAVLALQLMSLDCRPPV